MATDNELRAWQTTSYYQLLLVKELNKGTRVKGLRNAINLAKAAMVEPDIAWVEKQVAEAYG